MVTSTQVRSPMGLETLLRPSWSETAYGGIVMADRRRALWHLLGGTRGGPLRIRILRLLSDRPYNTNQIATRLGIDYKTAQHHLRVLKKNRLLDEQGTGKYGSVFFFTKDLEESLDAFEEIAARVAPENLP